MNKRSILNSNSNSAGRILSVVFLQLLLVLVSARCLAAQTNSIVIENALPGTPSSQWDISGAGDTSIQGYATDISVNQGGTISFKISTTASAYRIDIYRLGYYQGNGARYITTVMPSAHLPQSQPAPITDPSTGLIDYGNWAVSGSWQVPTNATSGLYIARLVRTDTGGASHIAFVVRNDSSTSDIYYKTSDTTWQAYNDYGGNSLYVGTGPGGGLAAVGRAYKVSYNRPFNTRGDSSQDWLFNAEYPMIRWLEANGYDVSYTTGVDADRRGSLLLQHHLLLSVGHDEYWSGAERTNVETARSNGVNLAFFSGNEIFWKTRWESSIDGSNTPYRTLVCYKETHVDAKIDPTPTWTGTWRDPRFSPPSDGGRPENALSGTIFISNTGITSNSIEIPAAFGKLRFWRNTTLATAPSGSTVAFPAGMLGYEWDQDPDNGFRAPGTIDLWSSTFGGVQTLQDFGSVYAYGVATHNLTLYRGSGGGLVFGAGTVQWSWGLDSNHDNGSAAPSPAIQQANINLFADMGVQPQTLQAGLVAATASSDHTPPVSTILTPASGANVSYASPVVVIGTASDTGGGRVAGVEVSTDGGATWHPASGLTNWSYSWIPLQGGPATIQVRAIDDSCNVQSPAAAVSVTVVSTPLTVWPSSAAPAIIDQGADNPLEVGVKFRSDVAGFITGIRFYKCSINIGTHIGDLWTTNGTHLASAPFTVETPSGWQQVNFTNPVPITSNTVYVASYHANNGHYSEDDYYFASNGVDNVPLHILADGVSGPNGIYSYGANSVFPTSTWEAANYWVDVAFSTTNAIQTLVSIAVSPTNSTLITGGSQQFTATGTYSNGGPQDITSQVTWTSTNTAVATVNAAGLVTAVSPGVTAIFSTMNSVTGSTLLTVQTGPLSITSTSLAGDFVNTAYAATLSASGGTMPYTWSIISGSLPNGLTVNTNTGAITGTPTTAGTFNFTAQVSDASLPVHTATQPLSITITSLPNTVTIWPSSAVPTVIDQGTDAPVELGVKFRSDIHGFITSVRFYKAAANTGTHIGDLWTTNGALLATATFTGETASGWQQVNFASPVSINSNTVYVASYHCNSGHYSEDDNYFTIGVDNPPLHALASGVAGGNGVFAYGATDTFPNQTFNAANYWVDVVFAGNLAPVLPAQINRVINELTTLTVTNTATDITTLSYTLAVTNVITGQVVTNASIGTNGVITWTPGQAQSPSTNVFTTIVSDGSLSATNSFTVTVTEVNVEPVLPAQVGRILVGTQSLTVTNTAGEPNIHSVTVGYALTGPSGSTIDTNGVIRWTPVVLQVPGVYTLTTVVSNSNPYDLVNPQLSATNSFTVTVQTVHNGPALGVVSNQVVNELTLLTVTNAATDNDIPLLPLSYTLVVTNVNNNSTVTNASISTNGVITWTPTEAQGPSTNTFTTIVSDGSLSATNSFTVTVNEVNVAPTLPVQSNRTLIGTQSLTVTNTASDSDIPVNPLGYVLTGPTGSTIDTNGVIRWAPTVGQVPGVYTFTTVVTDTNVYAVNAHDLSATNSFMVTVQAIHNGPSLGVVSNQAVNELTLLMVTNAATDNDIPLLPLSYTLAVTNALTGGVVTNASISTNGIISWTPTEAQGPSTNTFTTIVSDGSLSATNSFTVMVNEVNVAPTLPVQSNRTLIGTQSLTVTNTASDSDIPVNPLGYVLTGPTGSTIDTNGVIRWTPTVGQVPGVYTFTTVVTDTNVYAVNAHDLSATNSFTVTVQAIHNGPSLGVVSNQAVNELMLLTVTNAATDNDIPLLPLSYTLVVTNVNNNSAVTNASISTNGVITWTPGQAQSPGTNVFTTIVSDGSLSATNSFTVTVTEVNVAPVLPAQVGRILAGTQSLTVTNTAGEPNIHSLTVGYALTGPSGSTIDTNGVIRWTPVVLQVPGVYTLTTVVSNSNPYDLVNPQLSATNSFTVTVQAVHNGPALGVVSNQVVNELTLLTVTNAATDNDIPLLPLSYTLVVTNVNNNSAVTNASISTNGVITWTPGQAQSPSTNVFTTIVSDGSLSATNSFTVTVTEVNVAPVLPAQVGRILVGTQSLTVTNTAGEPNIHSVTVGYALTGPSGSTIDTNGVIRWTPVVGQVPGVYTLTTVVSNSNPYDLVNPQLSVTNSFTVMVNAIHNGPFLPAQSNLTIDVLTPLVVTNTATDSDIPANALNYQLTGPSGSTIDSNGVIRWTPLSAQGGTTNFFITIVTDNAVPPLSATNSFEVMVNPAPVIPAPVIQSIAVSNGIATVTWSSVSNGIYRLQYVGDLGNTNWMDVSPDVQASGPAATATNTTGSAVQQFYRIMVVPLP
jgi:hypothetical protein